MIFNIKGEQSVKSLLFVQEDRNRESSRLQNSHGIHGIYSQVFPRTWLFIFQLT